MYILRMYELIMTDLSLLLLLMCFCIVSSVSLLLAITEKFRGAPSHLRYSNLFPRHLLASYLEAKFTQ